MDVTDLSHKLAYLGRHSPVPFVTGPEYTNSVGGVPTISMVRIFIEPAWWSEENVLSVAREIARTLGPTEQYDIGMTHTTAVYSPDTPAAGSVARLIKADPTAPSVTLLLRTGEGDTAYEARYPRLQFEASGTDFWRSIYDAGAVKLSQQE